MLDRKFIVENAESVKLNCRNRGVSTDIDTLVEIEIKRREKLQEVQELNRQANEVAKTIGQTKDAAEREARKEKGRQLRDQKDASQAEHDRLDEQAQAIQNTVPNMTQIGRAHV